MKDYQNDKKENFQTDSPKCGSADAQANIQLDTQENDRVDAQIDSIINMLDSLTMDGVSRIKIKLDEDISEETVPVKEHHHGRCDIGSPWARGCAFDVLED